MDSLIAMATSGPVSPAGEIRHVTDDSLTRSEATVNTTRFLYTARICLNAPGGEIFAYIVDTA